MRGWVRVVLFGLAPSMALSACEGRRSGPLVDPPSKVIEQVIDDSRILAVTEKLRLGGLDDEKTGFFRVGDVARDESGRLFVLDAGNHRVSVFGPTGELLFRFGRQGQGPGEFTRAGSLWWAKDTVAIGDQGNRFHLFTADGSHILTRAYLDLAQSDGLHTSSPVATPVEWVITAYSEFQVDESGSETTLPPKPKLQLFSIDANGDIDRTGFHWSQVRRGIWSGMYWVEAPFTPRAAWDIDGLGRVHIAATGDYMIDVYSIDGEPLYRLVNEVGRVRVDRKLLNRWEESRCPNDQGPECATARTETAMSLPIPQFVPVVGTIKAFPNGSIAVRRADTDPDPFDSRITGDWDFFDPQGRFLGRITGERNPRWFDGETLIVKEWGAMGEEYVVVYQVGDGGTGTP